MRKSLLCFCLLCLSIVARGQTGYEYAYWVDNSLASGRMSVTSGDSWQTDIDVSYLNEGFHSLHVQVRDEKGRWSSPVTRHFYKLPKTDNMVYYYWFDTGNEPLVCNNEEVMWLDVSKLDDGMHTLHIQLGDEVSASVVNFHFLKIPQIVGVDYMTCLCYIDGNLYHQERVAQVGDVLPWTFDVSGMEEGIHSIRIQVVTPAGVASSVYESMFVRSITNDELASLDFLYTIDDKEGEVCEGGYMDGGYHFDLDVSALEDGIHKLSYTLVGDDGISTKFVSRFFVKSSLGSSGITQYWYWLNENEAEKTVVQLDEPANPYQLIGLLPVETVPIRSSLFHFEVDGKDGPMLYAKNEFHVRFYDTTGRLVDATKPYVDYNVSEKVANITRLDSTQTMPKPAENEIRWFKFDAEVGDSIAFKTDKACSINVFNAEGDEIYAASGSDAVNYDGAVIQEDGDYYVALHDVTATQGENVTLDFVHVGKYAVLKYSPDCIGLLGESFAEIKLFGNGYDKLKRAYLQSPTSVLQPDSIAILNRMNAKMVYSFDESVELGLYDIVLEFEEEGESESLVIENAVTIEDGEWIEPEVTVSSERSLARPYPVKVTVKNNSNVGMVYVPLNIAFDNVDKFDRVDFMNFSMLIPDTALVGDYRPFFVTEDFLGEGISALVMYLFIPQLNPGETKEYVLGFTGPSHARFNMYAWAGEALNHPNPSVDTLTNIPSMWYYLDEYGYLDEEPSVQSAQTMRNGMSRVARLRRAVGRARAAADNTVGAGMAIGGIVNGLRRNNYEATLRARGYSPGDPMWNDIMELAGPMPTPDEINDGLLGLWRFSRRNRPYPQSTPVEILNPGDPNDIIGYSAESGSKYVKEGLVDVGYTIQFENDPDIATAAAHKIVVKDTLDGNLFDLSTFAATGVLIGDKRLELNGEKSFVKTIDLRTRINVIAEVSLDYDEAQGIATWTIRSLDPMTMEETMDYMQGVLPVNYDGNGQGELYFNVKLREGLSDGTEIPNRASIVFDFEEAIITPTWVNTIDNTLPSSDIISIEELNDTTVRIHWAGEDTGSDIYKYALYVQEGKDGEWSRMVSDTTDVYCDYRYYRDIDYGFCVLATDSAGNVESTEWVRKAEFMREYIAGDADRSGTVNLLDINMTLSHILGNEVSGCDMLQMDANKDGSINVLDINAMLQIILNADGEGATLRKRNNGLIRIINTKVL